jgi:cell division protein FtsL
MLFLELNFLAGYDIAIEELQLLLMTYLISTYLLIYDTGLQVETLAVQLSQREGELLQQKEQVKKLATSLKLVSHKEHLLSSTC